MSENIQRGERIKFLRSTAGATRKELAQHLDATVAALRVWEDGIRGGLTEKGAEKLVNAFQKLGITCTKEWLMYGTTEKNKMPNIQNKINSLSQKDETIYEEKNINNIQNNEIDNIIESYMNTHKNAVLLSIPDEAMEPLFLKDDIIIATKCSNREQIQMQINRPCIVKFNDLIVCRKLEITDNVNEFNLVPINLNMGIFRKINPDYVAAITIFFRKLNFN